MDLNKALAGQVEWQQGPTQSSNNATVTVTQPASAKLRFFVTGFEFSSTAPVTTAASFQIKDGATVISQLEINTGFTGPLIFDFRKPLACSVNSSAIATVTGLGSSVKGTITLRGMSDTP